MKVSDIHKEGCKLNWKRPEDDGGTPIEYYLVEKFDVQKGSWIPCGQSPETGMSKINIKKNIIKENNITTKCV